MKAAIGPPAPGNVPKKEPIIEPSIIGVFTILRSETFGSIDFIFDWVTAPNFV